MYVSLSAGAVSGHLRSMYMDPAWDMLLKASVLFSFEQWVNCREEVE